MKETAPILISDNDIRLLNDSIYQRYGYDFSDYSQASFKRRISKVMIRFQIMHFEELKNKVIRDELFFNSFLEEVTVNVTEMFRDPEFFKLLRQVIIPGLAENPLIRIWHAGCSTGEEVYSMAVILKEANLLEKSLLYATDINLRVLEMAASGKFPIDLMKKYNENYLLSGGQRDLSEYYTPRHGKAVFHPEFKTRAVFSPHNLVFDQSFNEFNLILCRNVLIYFNNDLQNKVIRLFADSLTKNGILALGGKETIYLSDSGIYFEPVNTRLRVWKKSYSPATKNHQRPGTQTGQIQT